MCSRPTPTIPLWEVQYEGRSWGLDALRCPECGDRMTPVAVVQDPAEAERYLRHRDEYTPLPTAARARGPPRTAA